MDQARYSTSVAAPPADPFDQGSNRKSLTVQHHQDQDALRSCVSHIQKLQAKSTHIRKRQTRRITKYYEGLQDRILRDWSHVLYRKNPLPTYYVVRGGSKIIRRLGRSSWEHNQQ